MQYLMFDRHLYHELKQIREPSDTESNLSGGDNSDRLSRHGGDNSDRLSRHELVQDGRPKEHCFRITQVKKM